jgi:thiol-disulfide isomerase/thioredoxin
MTGLYVLLAVLVVAGVLAWWLRAREGRIRTTPIPGATTPAPEPEAPARPELPGPVRAAVRDGPGVTLVQISTTFCAPCRHARAVLSQLAGSTEGVRHVDLDVTDRPEVAAALGVYRTPTTLAYTGDGTELLRVGGVPKAATLLDALRPHLV